MGHHDRVVGGSVVRVCDVAKVVVEDREAAGNVDSSTGVAVRVGGKRVVTGIWVLVDGGTVGPPVVGVGVGPVVAGELVGTGMLGDPVGGVVGAGVGLVDDGPAVGRGVGADEAGAAVGAAVGLLPDGAVVGTEVGPGIGDRVSTLRSPKHLSGFDLRTVATSAVSEHTSTSVTSPEPR